ncbi:uncharacterized protein LOC132062465 [Lycium ferocissimum]|uniref:uncharacterized protein LOC132062465 n=1 Tax=Lycium ferocissimum TaxID=112874 RepID=UPI0028161AC4|nr:uncharacterized protein LOC132062465 [Lycium ferocissimum]
MNTNNESLTLFVGRGQEMKSKRPVLGSGFGIICEYYGYKDHFKENYYRIISFPPDFKSKKKLEPVGEKPHFGETRSYANTKNASVEASTSSSFSQGQGHFFTEDQYKKLLNFLSKAETSETSDYHSNMAGALQ